ncbi:MAG: HAD-IIA family hydrolase [Rhizobiaceae bacterium]
MPLSDHYGVYFEGFDAVSAFAFYEAVRSNLPTANFPATSRRAGGLQEIADQIDVFVFDAYGVLNVGSTPIEGATQTVAALRQMGKRVFVLTNSATFPAQKNFQKFQKFGFDFSAEEIISSRMGAHAHVAAHPARRWGVVGKLDSAPEDFGVETRILGDDPADYDWAEAFLLLSTWDWNTDRQILLDQAFQKNPRPMVVANPDVIAPLELAFSTEPGFIGHRTIARFGGDVVFHGKPFASVFELVMQRLAPDQLRSRIAMVGDTLHTDVLGGAAQGWSTVLVSDHGLFRGQDIAKPIAESQIVPTYIVPQI